MFLDMLDDDQKDGFLALAANIASPATEDLFNTSLWGEWLAEMGLPPRTRIAWDDASEAARRFVRPEERAGVMVELGRLAREAADEPEALSAFLRIGSLLGFQQVEVDAFYRCAQPDAMQPKRASS